MREQVFAAFFGAGRAYDAYVIAVRLPSLFRDLLAEGALSAAFVKSSTQSIERDGEASAILRLLQDPHPSSMEQLEDEYCVQMAHLHGIDERAAGGAAATAVPGIAARFRSRASSLSFSCSAD